MTKLNLKKIKAMAEAWEEMDADKREVLSRGMTMKEMDIAFDVASGEPYAWKLIGRKSERKKA